MLPQEKKPAINLDFNDPSVKKLVNFIQRISEHFKDESNLPITVKVLECLVFIKLNFPWITYAISNKEKDNTIYKYAKDRVSRVLRAHNDMSFHVLGYDDSEKAISDYTHIITSIENGIDQLLESSAHAKTFIRKIQDSAVGCMEARLQPALDFITDTNIQKLDDLFQDFFAEQTKLGINPEDIDKFISHLTNYFSKKIDDIFIHDGKHIILNWDDIKEYLENFFGYDEELKPLSLLKDTIITTTKDNAYVLNFSSQQTAEKYLTLIKLSLPKDLSLELKKTDVLKQEVTFDGIKNNNFLYKFHLTQEQFHIISILLEKSIDNLIYQKDIYSLLASLITALNTNFEELKSLINRYPALKNFMINKEGELIVHSLVRNNKLEQLKILVEECQLDINAQIDSPKSTLHSMTPLFLACYLKGVSDELLEYLLQTGADINTPDHNGTMPLEQLLFTLSQASKVKVVLANSKMTPKGDMSLIYAVEKHSFENYALTLHKLPTEDLYINYLKDLTILNSKQNANNHVTQTEVDYVRTRKLWSDVVSETYLKNQQYSQDHDIKGRVISRLKAMGVRHPIKTYQDCMAYIRRHSVITLSFNAAFLKKGLIDFQPLNMWQVANNQPAACIASRDYVEKGLFNFLGDELKNALFDNKSARPRYSALWLLDEKMIAPRVSSYGHSFLVLKDIVKLNSIFCPGDSFNCRFDNKEMYTVSTFHHLEFLLWQCPPPTLQAIVNRVRGNGLEASNYDPETVWSGKSGSKGGYFEAMIPAFNIFDPNFVEHIHIHRGSYVLSQEDVNAIQCRGITVSNANKSPYIELGKKFIGAPESDVSTLSKKYPLLEKIFVRQTKLPTHLAELKTLLEKLNNFAIKNDFKQFKTAWNRLEEAEFIRESKSEDMAICFSDFSSNSIQSVFQKLIERKNENIAKLFFHAKLIDIGNLLDNFLYPKRGSAKDSLFYNYISYGIEKKNETFLNLLFSQIPESQRVDFIELFQTECLDYLEKINHPLAREVLAYLKHKNYLNLELGYTAFCTASRSNLLLQEEYSVQIFYLLMRGKALSVSQAHFLKNCPTSLLISSFKILVDRHAINEVRNLISSDIAREKLGEQCEVIDEFFYESYLEKSILDCQEKLKNLAWSGDFEKFKENWELIVNLYRQDKKQIDAIHPSLLNSIFNYAIKGGNTQIADLILKSNLMLKSDFIDINVIPPLTIAICQANREMVNFLLEKGITIWSKKAPFLRSPVWTAISMDFEHDKESAYYFNLLFSKMNVQSKSDLLEKFKSDYLAALSSSGKEKEAGWTLNFLLKKDCLNVEELLQNSTFHNSSVFCTALLEKIICLNINGSNEPTVSQINFIKNNKKNLNQLVLDRIEQNLFSPIELEKFSKQLSIFNFLNKEVQKAIIETCKINQCKTRPVTLMLVKEIIDFADKQLEQNETSLELRENVLKNHIFYQEMRKFITQISARFREKKVNDNTELDDAEIQTLLVIIENFQKETINNKGVATWYEPPFQCAIKQFCNTPSLSLLANKKVSALDALPRFSDVMEKANKQYLAYLEVMQPEVMTDLRAFNLDDENAAYNEYDVTQATEFIANRLIGTWCLQEGIEKEIDILSVEKYLKDILAYGDKNPFVFVSDPNPVPVETFEVLSDIGAERGAACTVSQHSNAGVSDNFRLNPTQLNNLILSYAEGPAAKDYRIDEGMIETTRKYKIETHYKKLSKENQLPLFIFQTVCDSKDGDINVPLAFINDVIQTFFKAHARENVRLLLPMAQCRFQLGIQKKHYVLVEITPEKITLHNSQSRLSTVGYLNCLNDLKLGKVIACNYNQQKDGISCGFFVYSYIKSILQTGNSNQLADIFVNLEVMVSNPSLLEDSLNVNLVQMKSDARKIKESGEALPWKKELLERVLAKNYQEKLDQLSEAMNHREELQATDNNPGGENLANTNLLSAHGVFKEARRSVSTLEAVPPSDQNGKVQMAIHRN
jgi:Ankyrin repeat